MFRRFRRATFQASTINPDQMQTLSKANQLIASGLPGQAAPLFAKVASEMETAAHPRRAANLHAQAAHAYADSQNEQAALNHSRIALNLFIQSQMANRTSVFYVNITHKFTNKGMKSAADTLIREFGSKVGSVPAREVTAPPLRQLPTNCPKCSAPIHKNDASWMDDQTIECDFCGSLIKAE
ncbi:MAG TPA: hypothetical protein VF359_01845 [Anaerolineales bacterium]